MYSRDQDKNSQNEFPQQKLFIDFMKVIEDVTFQKRMRTL